MPRYQVQVEFVVSLSNEQMQVGINEFLESATELMFDTLLDPDDGDEIITLAYRELPPEVL